MPQATYLDKIVAAHRARSLADPRDPKALVDAAEARALAVAGSSSRGFADAVADSRGLAVIAEIKRRSPSKGVLSPRLDPADVAREYAAGGAACISVLTDSEFFGGSGDDLSAARGACSLPALRKDFTVGEADVCDARLMDADAVLLIVAVLDDAELASFHTLTNELGMDALVEVHDEAELERALEVGAELIGVNQRDLTTFEVDTQRALRLAPAIPPEVVAVAESGIEGVDDARRLADAGYQAVLVGEWLIRSSDRSGAVSQMNVLQVGSRHAQALTE